MNKIILLSLLASEQEHIYTNFFFTLKKKIRRKENGKKESLRISNWLSFFNWIYFLDLSFVELWKKKETTYSCTICEKKLCNCVMIFISYIHSYKFNLFQKGISLSTYVDEKDKKMKWKNISFSGPFFESNSLHK